LETSSKVELSVKDGSWPWRQSLDAPGCHYARLQARSATYGKVTLIAVDKSGEDRCYLMALATSIPATRLLRLWSRRPLIEQVFRTLKSLLATDACQVRSEDAYYVRVHRVNSLKINGLIFKVFGLEIVTH
jgi:hypothetical protein